MDKPMDVLEHFPVRKSKKQKSAFLEAVLAYGQQLGYQTSVEKGSMGVRNVVLGNPETAKYLVTAHYDTCARMFVPNFITPGNFLVYLLYQLLLTAGILFVALLFQVASLLITDHALVSVIVLEVVFFGMFLLMMIGPANRNNANDNTSGVVTVLKTAETLPQELRSSVCFVLFDLEEAGLLGSGAYRKKHKHAIKKQIVLNLDCVGDGDEIVLFPSSSVKKDQALVDALNRCSFTKDKKQIYLKKGFGFYPSDQVGFPKGIGIAALKRSKLVGLYMNRIHTRRDTILEEENVTILCEYLIGLIGSTQQG